MADCAAMIAARLLLILAVLLVLHPLFLPHFACSTHFFLLPRPQYTFMAVSPIRLSCKSWLQCINFIRPVLRVRLQYISFS